MKRPRRQRKGDRLMSPDARQDEIRCDYALAPFDRAARAMEEKWGIDRLPGLVPPEMAERYGSAIAKLNAAINASNPEDVAARAAVCIRGLDAMDKAATEAGHEPATGDFWEYDLDGFRFAVLHDKAEWQTAHEKRPDLQFYSRREVAMALKAYANTVPLEAVKRHFPGSEINSLPQSNLPKDFFKNGGDEIPW